MAGESRVFGAAMPTSFAAPLSPPQARDSARRRSILETPMRSEYDFSKSRKNPYANRLKRQITIRLDIARWTTSRKWRLS
jgi:hypothetical protein